MFKFGKQKKVEDKFESPEINTELVDQIHTMPQRFYLAPKKKRSVWPVVIVLVILLLGGLVGFAVYLNQRLNRPQATPPVQTTGDVNVDQRTNINQPPSVNANVNLNTDISATTSLNLNTNLNANINANINANLDTNGDGTSEILPSYSDSDNDGLTLAEETLYGTNSISSDTDNDSYTDGSELLNRYDPLAPNKTLAESGLFISYNHPLYSLIYPRGWTLREQDEAKTEVLFMADTGEFVEILIISNINQLSLTDWYDQQFGNLDLAIEVEINNLVGLRHPNQQSYYLVDSDDLTNIFLLTYNIGDFTEMNFLTTFNVMVQSFKLLP